MKPFKRLHLTVEDFVNGSLQPVKLLFSGRFELFARKIKSLENIYEDVKSPHSTSTLLTTTQTEATKCFSPALHLGLCPHTVSHCAPQESTTFFLFFLSLPPSFPFSFFVNFFPQQW